MNSHYLCTKENLIQTEVDQCEVSGGDMSTSYNGHSEAQQKEKYKRISPGQVSCNKDEDVLELINEADAGDGEIDLEFLHAKLDERIETPRVSKFVKILSCFGKYFEK